MVVKYGTHSSMGWQQGLHLEQQKEQGQVTYPDIILLMVVVAFLGLMMDMKRLQRGKRNQRC